MILNISISIAAELKPDDLAQIPEAERQQWADAAAQLAHDRAAAWFPGRGTKMTVKAEIWDTGKE